MGAIQQTSRSKQNGLGKTFENEQFIELDNRLIIAHRITLHHGKRYHLKRHYKRKSVVRHYLIYCIKYALLWVCPCL